MTKNYKFTDLKKKITDNLVSSRANIENLPLLILIKKYKK